MTQKLLVLYFGLSLVGQTDRGSRRSRPVLLDNVRETTRVLEGEGEIKKV